jgi:hypothetical protein
MWCETTISLGAGSDIFYRKSKCDAFSQSIRPNIVTSDDEVHIAWQEGVPNNIFDIRSVDGGNTFSVPVVNLSDNSGNPEWPRLAVLNNNVYCPTGHSTAYQSSFSTFLRNMLPQPF